MQDHNAWELSEQKSDSYGFSRCQCVWTKSLMCSLCEPPKSSTMHFCSSTIASADLFFNKSMPITPEIHCLRNLSTIFNYKIVLLKALGFLTAVLMRNAARLSFPHSQSILNPKHNRYSIMAPDLCVTLQIGSYAVACSHPYLCIQRTIPRTPPFLKAICT